MPRPSHSRYDGVPQFSGIEAFVDISGISRSRVYELIKSGDIIAHKIASRTLIDVWHGLQWISNQPRALVGNAP